MSVLSNSGPKNSGPKIPMNSGPKIPMPTLFLFLTCRGSYTYYKNKKQKSKSHQTLLVTSVLQVHQSTKEEKLHQISLPSSCPAQPIRAQKFTLTPCSHSQYFLLKLVLHCSFRGQAVTQMVTLAEDLSSFRMNTDRAL